MQSLTAVRSAAIALVLSLGTILGGCGQSPSTYVFSTTTAEIPMTNDATVDVRIVRASDNTPVADAVIFETRFDMEPDGMAAMTSTVEAKGSPAAGVYRFAVKPTMEGRWKLTLSAKIQGEADTVKGSVVVTAR